MTAKQRAARAKFKAVVKEAQKLRKKNPKLTQAQAVKQAWAISYAKKTVSGYSKERKELNKRVTVEIRKKRKKNPDDFLNIYRKKEAIKDAYVATGLSGIKKKSATKVKAKKSKSTEMHTDTKSHNVNIRVISGTKDDILSKYIKTKNDIEKLERVLIRNKETQKKTPYKTDFWKKHFSYQNKLVKKYITELKKHKAELKKMM